MLTIDKQLRHFAVKVNNGSGCIFQPDSKEYTYVLTVKHNLESTNDGEKILIPAHDIKIYRGNADGEPIPNIVSYEVHDTLDLALIVIPYVGETEIFLTHSIPVRDEHLVIYGYPSRLNGNAEKRENVWCVCDMQREDLLSTEIRTEQAQYTWEINSQKSLVGFSGCGVFAEVNGALVLKGIFPELKDPSGANNKLISIYISNFNSIADKLGRKHLISSDLLSFAPYKGKVFHGLDHYLKKCMADNLESVTSGPITPILIAEQRKKILLVPTSEKYEDSLSQPKLWIAWLELLTLLNISNPEIQDLNGSCSVIPLYFSLNQHLIKGIIKVLITDPNLTPLIRKNSLIAFSSLEEAGSLDYLSKEKIRNIIAKVDMADPFGAPMMIDRASSIPDFSIIHIKHFQTKIALIDIDNQNSEEILESIKQEIINILSYAS